MYVLIVSTMVAYTSLFSSAAALSQYTIQGLTLEQCKTLGDKEKHEEKMNTTFSKVLWRRVINVLKLRKC